MIQFSIIQENIIISLIILVRGSSSLFEALQDVFEKYLMEMKFVNPLLLIGVEGVIGLSIMIILFIFVGPITCGKDMGICIAGQPVDDFQDGMNYLLSHRAYLYMYCGQIVLMFLYNICRMYVNYHFTPAHRLLSKRLRALLIWILYFFREFGENQDEKLSVLFGEGATFLFQLIGISIFVELIIIEYVE